MAAAGLAGPLVGNALLALSRPADAVAHLEQAIGLREAGKGDPGDLAEARFALAKALWESGRDKKRALALAAAARGPLEAAGAARKELSTELGAWLAARKR